MVVHHVATVLLMYFSWIMNFVRVGTLVLLVHDVADSWLAVSTVHYVFLMDHELCTSWYTCLAGT